MINKNNKGYTLLFAVIVSSIVLSVAAFILSVSRKQFILASAARDSTIAVYAADSGIQCALKLYAGYSTSTSKTFSCNEQDFTATFSSAGSVPSGLNYDGEVYLATIDKLAINGSCVNVTIYDGFVASGEHKTVIESRGYNIGSDTECPANNPREEERAIRLIYHD